MGWCIGEQLGSQSYYAVCGPSEGQDMAQQCGSGPGRPGRTTRTCSRTLRAPEVALAPPTRVRGRLTGTCSLPGPCQGSPRLKRMPESLSADLLRPPCAPLRLSSDCGARVGFLGARVSARD